MRAPTVILILGLALAIGTFGKRSNTRRNSGIKPNDPYATKGYNNPLYSEYDEPSDKSLEDLLKLKDLRVLEFYQALNELYLTGGFEKTGTINKIILSQPEIPNDTFQLLIRTLRATRQELKNGDASLSEINAQLEGTQDSALTFKLFEAVKEAVRNSTQTSDGDQDNTFLQKISTIELESMDDLKALNDGNGEDAALLSSLLEELKSKVDASVFKKMSTATQNAFYTGVGGVEDVKNALVGGARLIYNMGLENAKSKCRQLQKAYETEQKFERNLERAGQIVKRLNRSEPETGVYGYTLMFENYFDNLAPQGNQVFGYTGMMKLTTVLPFLKDLESITDVETLMKVLRNVTKDKYRVHEYRGFLDSLQNDEKVIGILNETFDINIQDKKVAFVYRNILETLAALSVDSAYFMRLVKSVKDIVDTGDYNRFMTNLVRYSELSRDHSWRDVFQSTAAATEISSELPDELIAPFRGLNDTVIKSYEEVFLGMKQILEGSEEVSQVNAKCTFIDEFFTGLTDRDTVLKALGIQVEKIHAWNDATEYIDALTDLLKAADTFKNLNRILDYHARYTTVDKKPLESMALIENFINYLEQSSRWNKKKRQNRRS